jgi:hypothetical protein
MESGYGSTPLSHYRNLAMKIAIAGAGLAAALILAGCASAPLIPPSAQVTTLKVVYGFEATYNTAAKLYLAKAPTLTPAQRVLPKQILADMFVAVTAAKAAADAGDATTQASQITTLQTLAAQLTSVLAAL